MNVDPVAVKCHAHVSGEVFRDGGPELHCIVQNDGVVPARVFGASIDWQSFCANVPAVTVSAEAYDVSGHLDLLGASKLCNCCSGPLTGVASPQSVDCVADAKQCVTFMLCDVGLLQGVDTQLRAQLCAHYAAEGGANGAVRDGSATHRSAVVP